MTSRTRSLRRPEAAQTTAAGFHLSSRVTLSGQMEPPLSVLINMTRTPSFGREPDAENLICVKGEGEFYA